MFIAWLGILLWGCDADELEFDDIQVQPITGTYSVPIGEVSYTIRELIENQEDSLLTITEDENSLLTLYYTDSISYETDTDFVEIDDITNFGEYDLSGFGASPTLPGVIIDFDSTYLFDYEAVGDEVIDSVFYEDGTATINVTSTINGVLDFTFTILNTVTTVNEVPLELSGSVDGPGSGSAVRSLAFHKMLLTEDVNNTFGFQFAGTLDLDDGQVLDGDEFLSFELTFANQTFEIVYGKFGQDTVQVGQESLDIEFFREMGEEGIFFGDPTLRFNFESTLGIPLGIDFSTLYGNDGAGGDSTFLGGDIVETIPVVESSPITDPGSIMATTIELNKDNSTIVDLLATSPAQLGFDVFAIANPYDVSQINFVTQTNQLNASIEIVIPMTVKLEDLQQSGTLSLGEEGIDVKNVDSAFLRVVTVNELPFSGSLSMAIQDADSNVLHTIPEEIVLNAPFININGFVTDPNGISADIFLSQEGIQALGEGRMIELTVTLNTPESLNSRDIFVKLLADYALDIKVGVGGSVNIDIDI